MFGIFARLGKIRIGALDTRVLIAVTELLGEGAVTVMVMFFGFSGALGAVGIIIRNLRHGETPDR